MQLLESWTSDSAAKKMEKKEFSEWTSLDLSQWLNENGLPQDICETFEGKFVIRQAATCLKRDSTLGPVLLSALEYIIICFELSAVD